MMAPRRAHYQRYRWRNSLSRLLAVAAATALAVGIMVSGIELVNNIDAERRAAAETNAANHHQSSGAPSTVKASSNEFNNYTVAPSRPRYLFIPSIQVRAMVKPLGITAGGAIDTPSNVYDVGWYDKSSLPGKPGATVIDGHVTGWQANGVFYNLDKLVLGSTITIERGDGTLVIYRVARIKFYDANRVDLAALSSSADPKKSGLNLITCAGELIPSTGQYNKRLVVYAVQT